MWMLIFSSYKSIIWMRPVITKVLVRHRRWNRTTQAILKRFVLIWRIKATAEKREEGRKGLCPSFALLPAISDTPASGSMTSVSIKVSTFVQSWNINHRDHVSGRYNSTTLGELMGIQMNCTVNPLQWFMDWGLCDFLPLWFGRTNLKYHQICFSKCFNVSHITFSATLIHSSTERLEINVALPPYTHNYLIIMELYWGHKVCSEQNGPNLGGIF